MKQVDSYIGQKFISKDGYIIMRLDSNDCKHSK